MTPGQEEHPIFARWGRAKERRTRWEGLFDECFSYTMPNRERFYEQSTLGQRQDDEIYDETAVHGVQEFASRLQAGLVPNFQKWIDLKAGRLAGDNEFRKQMNTQLNEVSEFIFEIIQDSNFSTEIHESFLDLSVSCGCIAVFEGDAMQPLIFRSIPITRLWFDEGPDGDPNPIFYRDTVKGGDLIYAWPGSKLDTDTKMLIEQKPHEDIDVIYGVMRDWSKPEETWDEYVFLEKDKKIIRHRTFNGMGSNPLIVFRWSVAAHEVWGRGPVITSLSAIKTTNLTLQLILENASMSIAGMWQTDDDLVLNTDTLELVPGAIIPRRAGRTGLEPLNPGGNFNVGDIILGEQRQNIRRGLHGDMLGNDGKTPVSAAEVMDQRAEEGRRMGSAFGRLQSELVTPLVKRIIYILKRRNLIQMPKVETGGVSIRSNSPLSQAQMAQEVSNWTQFYQVIGGLFGQQMLQAAIKQEVAVDHLKDKFNVPDAQIRSVAELQELLQNAQAQMQQAGVELQPNPQDAPPNLNGGQT